MGTALAITAIGMALLFLTLALFYGLLSLMASLMGDRPSRRASATVTAPVDEDGEAALRAAAIAVALARAAAEKETVSIGADRTLRSPTGTSPWWALHHQRSLGTNCPWRRHR